MVKDISLNAKIREKENVKTLREKGLIPAVVYGRGQKNISLSLDYQEFKKALETAGESTIIKLKVNNEIKNVLIYDVAKDPITDKFIHIDFYQVRMDEIITAEVRLAFEGESSAVKTLEGILIKTMNEVEVEALPGDLPHELKIDLSILETFDDHIKIKDIKLPEGVKIKLDPEDVVASVAPPRTQEELEELEEKPEEVVEPEKVDADIVEETTEQEEENND
ncbi:50S ribosomal protein L25 [Patescibacteria group bacterium]|nr:50S ribosomal protein L25 [Patescibacteria group bacterium]MBU3922831.1 50S ribosomal protein L25 [Patescibacteria group bacterium]